MRLAHVLTLATVPFALMACDVGLDAAAADASEVLDSWADGGEVVPTSFRVAFEGPGIHEDRHHRAEQQASLDPRSRHGIPEPGAAQPEVEQGADDFDAEGALQAFLDGVPRGQVEVEAEAETALKVGPLVYIRGLDYDDQDPRQHVKDVEPESMAPDGQWIGLVSKGRVLITDFDEEDFGPATFKLRRKYRRYVARKVPTKKALATTLAGWVGRPLEAIDAKGGTCRGVVSDLYAEAVVVIGERKARSWKGAINEASRHMATAQEVFELDGPTLWGEVKWSSRRCAREAVVARTAGATMPTVFVADKVAHDRRGYLVETHYLWSPEWKLMQERFEKTHHGTELRRIWTDSEVSSAMYRAGDTYMGFATSGNDEEGCDTIGESMGMLMTLDGEVVTTVDRWGLMNNGVPDVVLHFSGTSAWLGLDVGNSLYRLGYSDTDSIGGTVMTPAFDCGC